jgi:hypothetical protein
MPVERVSKGFVDISMSFATNPMNKDLITLKNESAISRSLMNLVFTSPGERFFNENLGSAIGRSLFENINEITSSMISEQIRATINSYEPRVKLIDVTTSPDYDNNGYYVTINYKIVGINVPTQNLSFVLQPIR